MPQSLSVATGKSPFTERTFVRRSALEWGEFDGKIEASGANGPLRDCLHTGISETIGRGVGLAGRSESFFFYARVVPNTGHACRWGP